MVAFLTTKELELYVLRRKRGLHKSRSPIMCPDVLPFKENLMSDQLLQLSSKLLLTLQDTSPNCMMMTHTAIKNLFTISIITLW